MSNLPSNPVNFNNKDWQQLFKERALANCLQITIQENPASLWSPYPSFDLSNLKDGDGFNYTIPNISGEITEVSTFNKIVNTYSQSGYQTTEATIGVPGIASGSVSTSSSHEKSGSFSKQTYYCTTMFRVPKLRLVLDQSKLVLTQQFIDALNTALSAPEKPTQFDNLISFLQKWGYYVATDIELGGLYFSSLSEEVTTMEEAESFSTSMKVSFSADLSAFDVPVSGGASHGSGSSSSSGSSSTDKFKNMIIQIIGGNPAYRNNWEKWVNSMEGNYNEWHIINTLQLVPVINFIPDQQTRFKVADLIQSYPSSNYNTDYIDAILKQQQPILND